MCRCLAVVKATQFLPVLFHLFLLGFVLFLDLLLLFWFRLFPVMLPLSMFAVMLPLSMFAVMLPLSMFAVMLPLSMFAVMLPLNFPCLL